jgi:metal-dependent amidase/aminoacylase/carboxypeptidase family protein
MTKDNANSSDLALGNLAGLLPDLTALYKDIHSHPELSMQETRTAQLAADRLHVAGFDVTTGVGKTGVVGLLRNGDGPTVMLRADMDALPILEATGLSYASKVTATGRDGMEVPVSHMCGHDLHVTWLVGATRLLADARFTWRGTVEDFEEQQVHAFLTMADGTFIRQDAPLVEVDKITF